MKTTLRHRFFSMNCLLVLLVLCVSAFAAVVFNLYEVKEHTGHWGVELDELGIMFGINVLAIPILLGVAWKLSARMLQPIAQIAREAELISRENRWEHVKTTDRQGTLANLVHSINYAFDRYRDSAERMRHFTSDASHQLRTPLTALRSMGEVTLSRDRTTDEYRDTMGSMLEEVSKLSHIVEQLLMLSRLDAGDVVNHFVKVDLGEVVNTALTPLELLWQEKKIRMLVETLAPVEMDGMPALLQQVVLNLVDNAIRHTPSDGQIRVTTALEGRLAVLTVEDSGEGIPSRFLPRIFERFSKGTDTGGQGSGLGLAIVAEVVKIHRGLVAVESSHKKGTRFTIRLPISVGDPRLELPSRLA